MCGHDHLDHHDHHDAPTPPVRRHRGTLERRTILAAGAGAGASLMVAGGLGAALPAARADEVTPPARRVGARRASRISRGTTLVHADMHNHSLMSDGDGDPAAAYGSMRSAGLDVAALTDHATISDNLLGDVLAGILPPAYKQLGGITPGDWAATGRLADSADLPGTFTAIRGFEWSEPLIGHVNVWFTEHYTDILQAGLMQPLLSWLAREPGLILDGGADGIAGFNHPGREPLRFQEFHYDERVRQRIVSLEMFNRRDDYLFEGHADGKTSPLVACLNAGWRCGITGVTDEHGVDWGFPEGKGRMGLWVKTHDRAGVKEAMLARRFFATRTSGLRVDAIATVGGVRRRMGRQLPLDRPRRVRLELDLAAGRQWRGRRLNVQVLRPGVEVPEVIHVEPFTVGDVVEFRTPRISLDDGDYLLLRISDPAEANATPGPAGHPGNELGIAYTSPWWFVPAA